MILLIPIYTHGPRRDPESDPSNEQTEFRKRFLQAIALIALLVLAGCLMS